MKAHTSHMLSDEYSKMTDAAALKSMAAALLKAAEVLEYSPFPNVSGGINYYDEVRNFETCLITRALRLTNGSQKGAALLLGIGPTTLNTKIKSYRINYQCRQSSKAIKPTSVSS